MKARPLFCVLFLIAPALLAQPSSKPIAAQDARPAQVTIQPPANALDTSSQNVTDWTIDAPPNTVQLVSVNPTGSSTNLEFTFSNVSGKSILNFGAVSSEQCGRGTERNTGPDAFMDGGEGAVAPGATFNTIFDRHFLQCDRTLHVVAILYTDGSFAGSEKGRDHLEEQMIGAAFETRRDADILSASPDPGISGFADVLTRIGNPLTRSSDYLPPIRGLSLPGIPQACVDANLNREETEAGLGVHAARERLIDAIDNAKRNAALLSSGSGRQQQLAQHIQQNGLADLAQKYRAASDAQIRYLQAFEKELHRN